MKTQTKWGLISAKEQEDADAAIGASVLFALGVCGAMLFFWWTS